MAALTIALVGVVAAACSSGGGGDTGKGGGAAKKGPVFTVTPANGAKKVAPNKPVTVKVTNGKLGKVTVTTSGGGKATGVLAKDGLSWRSTWGLRPDSTYTVTAQAAGDDGKPVTSRTTFTTLTPARKLETGLSPLEGEKVGIGMPVSLYFYNFSVTSAASRSAVERALDVSMSKPVEGAWSWVSPQEIEFRPRDYWPTGEKVNVVAHLTGLKLGGSWGMKDRSAEFTIGPRHITTVNNHSHMATVTDGGKVVRKIPVSLGKPGDDSYSGVMIAQEKAATTIMDSATVGHPGEYRLQTKWNVRMTYSGTYFHAAPWSTGAQGNSNVSHGCVNASPENAKWFYYFTNRGDIIEVKGTSRQVPFGSGPTPWAKSWSEWLKGSTLGKVVNGTATGAAPQSGAPAPTPS